MAKISIKYLNGSQFTLRCAIIKAINRSTLYYFVINLAVCKMWRYKNNQPDLMKVRKYAK